MAKKVRYNGGTVSYYSCSKPDKLVEGKEYDVVHIIDLGYQTNYTLDGVDGEFNSVWFDEIRTYMALGLKVPAVGERYHCFVMELNHNHARSGECWTSRVKSVSNICDNIYRVTTQKSVYIVKVE